MIFDVFAMFCKIFDTLNSDEVNWNVHKNVNMKNDTNAEIIRRINILFRNLQTQIYFLTFIVYTRIEYE